MARNAGVLGLGVVVVAASASLAAPARTLDRPADELRDCSTRGDSNRPQRLPTPPGVRIGPLVVWPSVRTSVEPTHAAPWRYYVKAPIIVPARAKVVLAVPARATSLVAFQTRAGRFASAVRFEACREDEPAFPRAYRGTVGRYTGFPFGFLLARRSACIPLEVWVDGQPTAVRRLVPFGRRACGA